MLYIADDKICFCLQGLRWIQKSDRQGFVDKKETTYFIKLQYKGAEVSQNYSSKEARDRIYDLAVERLIAIGKRQPPSGKEKRNDKV